MSNKRFVGRRGPARSIWINGRRSYGTTAQLVAIEATATSEHRGGGVDGVL